MAPVGRKALSHKNFKGNLPQPGEFEVAPSDNMTVRQQVSRSNLPLETKAAILTALEKPASREKKSQVYEAVKSRISDARELTGTTLEELEKVVQDALRATFTKVFYQKVYRENGKLWKVVPKSFREPDHAMRLRVFEIFMKPLKPGQKSKKQPKRVDVEDAASRLRDRETELEGGILDGNGNGDR